ncbi:recombinase family protein [Yoonia sp. SDW83-1]|uniref:recombinase family protein n=1 Tax=Yoonia sp. SDW83-1 TaxID=3366945 RepID=UPI00398C7B1E
MTRTRCAIYTRKSSEDGLEQEFNSLDAQREACEAYILSQKHEGWICLAENYDDGGLSGGALDRPALKRLLTDVRTGKVDQIVVYKIDRLTRSLADFSKIVDVLDAADASFVSVTQSFNTATSMGRLTLNMLLSFAQFEREVTAERIRDKISASKRKGLWMGGNVPLGYRPDGRTLTIHEPEADTVRQLYSLYQEHKRIRLVKKHADRRKLRTGIRHKADGTNRGGGPFSFGHIHHILTNPIYAGRIRHKTKVYDGQHPSLIEPELWAALQVDLQANARSSRQGRLRSRGGRKTTASPLIGKLFDETGDRLTPSHTKTGKGKRLRYYISHRLTRDPRSQHPSAWRLPAPELEAAIGQAICGHLLNPETVANTLTEADASRIARTQTLFDQYLSTVDHLAILGLVARVDLQAGFLVIALDRAALAEMLETQPDAFVSNSLLFTAPFQMRRRGVETKLVIGGQQKHRDETLLRNLAKGHRYFGMIMTGQSYAQIAEAENTSKRMVQHLTELAFLAPEIVEQICEGIQPPGLTTEWLKRHKIPVLWFEQCALITQL